MSKARPTPDTAKQGVRRSLVRQVVNGSSVVILGIYEVFGRHFGCIEGGSCRTNSVIVYLGQSIKILTMWPTIRGFHGPLRAIFLCR